ncbi:phosphatase PAP2 family protein [Pontibacter silvestris]|uniref:Phosphatase PAP2 family protein n=1 Tax=Pontibacter silvestris TaxID=2305183 RepID=A0ABW4WWS7_9BACT|nr:phosphatase PAP2 family protein [Pontibacter silvestris]MCC9136856.1 phosphatase PAP2 family protein [Pontibacter silvestris]
MKNILAHKVQRGVSWFLHQPGVVRFRNRYPRAADSVAKRFDAKEFSGLPLTLLVLVFLFNLLLLSQLADSVVGAEGIVKLDQKFTAFLYEARFEQLSWLLYYISYLGSSEAVFMLGAVITVLFVIKRRFVAILAFWLVMAGMGLSVRYGKTYISRDRPADVAYYPVKNFSFPSGHATTAMALYGMCAYFLVRHFKKNSSKRKASSWAGVILILLVGFTRIYLGVHYLSDVLAGFLLGILWVLLGISLMEVLQLRQRYKAQG